MADGDWRVYSNKKGRSVFEANRDTVTPVWTPFEPPVFASQVRLVPFSVHPRIVCVRFELHGCQDNSE